MRARRITIENFRGIRHGVVDFAEHTLLVGPNNVGKSTVCEALDLVLGPERLARRPVIVEHDFFESKYLNEAEEPTELRVSVVLLDLPDEARRRFSGHLRLWDEESANFVDTDPDVEEKELASRTWALPIEFRSRFDHDEDDFIADTFFSHPVEPPSEHDDEQNNELGAGLTHFRREQKRLCGFLFLRAIRTGSRALSLQRGSLLDTILRLRSDGVADMWEDTLTRLRGLTPAIGEIAQLDIVQRELRSRIEQFLAIPPGEDASAFFASELTRDSLREVVQLFLAVEPDAHLLPFRRLGTGSLSLLVFALLTFIADLKGEQSVMFAMEEPEIGLPPHTQRRVSRYVLDRMGQAIVSSHSPYIIEQFSPDQIVILQRDEHCTLTSRTLESAGLRPRTFRANRKQFSEAILSRAVLVVEGATEVALFGALSSALERFSQQALAEARRAALESSEGGTEMKLPAPYTHLDLAGISLFDAGGDGNVPKYGPVFSALGKTAFALYDKPLLPLGEDSRKQLASYDAHWESSAVGCEQLLAVETSMAAQRRFHTTSASRPDYPMHCGTYSSALDDDGVRKLTSAVLKERKGDGYGCVTLLIDECHAEDELPATPRMVLDMMQELLGISDTAGPVVASSSA